MTAGNGSEKDAEKKRIRQKGLEKIREAYEKVAQDEIGRLGIVQEILRKNTTFLRRIIASVGGRRGVTLSFFALIATVSNWRTTSGGFRPDMEIATRRRSFAASGAQSVEENMKGEHPTRFEWCSSVQTKMKRKFPGRMRSRKAS